MDDNWCPCGKSTVKVNILIKRQNNLYCSSRCKQMDTNYWKLLPISNLIDPLEYGRSGLYIKCKYAKHVLS